MIRLSIQRTTLIFFIAAFAFYLCNEPVGTANAQAQTQTIPEVIVLGKDSKLGQVTFSHVKHNGGTYSIDGTGPIGCVECHHTAQPAAELAKHPPLKTAWPADRTTTLTADLFNKGAAALLVEIGAVLRIELDDIARGIRHMLMSFPV